LAKTRELRCRLQHLTAADEKSSNSGQPAGAYADDVHLLEKIADIMRRPLKILAIER